MRITIRKFQELYKASSLEMEELDKAILLVMILTGKSEFEVQQLPVRKFNSLCKGIEKAFDKFNEKVQNDKPKNIIRTNGNWYYLNYSIKNTEMNAGRYVEIAQFSEDIIGNLHKILASMANPMKLTWKGLKIQKYNSHNHEKIAEDFLKADFSVAYHTAVFFWAVFIKSINLSHSYLLNQMEKKVEGEQLLKTFQDYSDGFITANWLANLKISV